jgi:hypothetical protein
MRRYSSLSGPVAQLAEQGTFNPKVAGSNPARPIRSREEVKRRGEACSGLSLNSLAGSTCCKDPALRAVVGRLPERRSAGRLFRCSAPGVDYSASSTSKKPTSSGFTVLDRLPVDARVRVIAAFQNIDATTAVEKVVSGTSFDVVVPTAPGQVICCLVTDQGIGVA